MKNFFCLLPLVLLALISCKSEEKDSADTMPPKVKQNVDFALLHREAMTHPSFHKVMQHPLVMAAQQANNEANDAYDTAKYSHPEIKPLMDQLKNLTPTDAGYVELYQKMQARAKELPELTSLLEKANSTLVDLIAAFGSAFQATEDGKELGKKFSDIANRQ